ncbi:MAG: hypothetical protein GY940_02020, partial [bacterium]|nr:hypothetical protein [bacterium]
IGYFYIDTTAYTNGIHAIQWTAKDSAGNTDGIGSRYFTIRNSGSSRSSSQNLNAPGQQQTAPILLIGSQLETIPVNHTEPISIQKGFTGNTQPKELSIDESGLFRVNVGELERLVIQLSQQSQVAAGYMEVGNYLRPLPIGSTLDRKNGKFYWQLGPGFVGDYRLVFIENSIHMGTQKKTIIVRVE